MNQNRKPSKDDPIISVLIGLAGACSNNPKTAGTDLLTTKALAFLLLHPETDDTAIQALIQEIRNEKYAISPGCAQCAFPCGNTSDYDMERIYHADASIRNAKLQILDGLRHIAAYLYPSRLDCPETPEVSAVLPFLYKALCQVSYDLDENTLLKLLEETRTILSHTQQDC